MRRMIAIDRLNHMCMTLTMHENVLSEVVFREIAFTAILACVAEPPRAILWLPNAFDALSRRSSRPPNAFDRFSRCLIRATAIRISNEQRHTHAILFYIRIYLLGVFPSFATLSLSSSSLPKSPTQYDFSWDSKYDSCTMMPDITKSKIGLFDA